MTFVKILGESSRVQILHLMHVSRFEARIVSLSVCETNKARYCIPAMPRCKNGQVAMSRVSCFCPQTAMKIQVSSTSHDLLLIFGGFNLQKRGNIEVKVWRTFSSIKYTEIEFCKWSSRESRTAKIECEKNTKLIMLEMSCMSQNKKKKSRFNMKLAKGMEKPNIIKKK